MRKILAVFFVIAWAAGEAPRLWWGAAWPVRPMDLAAGLIFLTEITSNKIYKSYRNIILIIAALAGSSILGAYAVRTLIYGWLIWRGREIFAPVRKWITPALLAFLVLGLGQYLFLPDMRFLLQSGWDEHYYRLIGTVLDPNYFGLMAGMIGLYFIDKWINGQMDKWKIRLLVILSFAVLVLTWSRASWVAIIAGLSVYLVIPAQAGIYKNYSNRFRIKSGMTPKVLIGLLILGLVLYIAPKPGGEGVNLLRTSSIEQRLTNWNQAIEVWRQHPWLGTGFKNYGSDLPSSSFLVVLQATGLAGAVGVVIGGIRVIRIIRKDRFWLAIAIMLGVHAVFNNTLFYPPVLGLLALLKCKYQILTLRAAS